MNPKASAMECVSRRIGTYLILRMRMGAGGQGDMNGGDVYMALHSSDVCMYIRDVYACIRV